MAYEEKETIQFVGGHKQLYDLLGICNVVFKQPALSIYQNLPVKLHMLELSQPIVDQEDTSIHTFSTLHLKKIPHGIYELELTTQETQIKLLDERLLNTRTQIFQIPDPHTTPSEIIVKEKTYYPGIDPPGTPKTDTYLLSPTKKEHASYLTSLNHRIIGALRNGIQNLEEKESSRVYDGISTFVLTNAHMRLKNLHEHPQPIDIMPMAILLDLDTVKVPKITIVLQKVYASMEKPYRLEAQQCTFYADPETFLDQKFPPIPLNSPLKEQHKLLKEMTRSLGSMTRDQHDYLYGEAIFMAQDPQSSLKALYPNDLTWSGFAHKVELLFDAHVPSSTYATIARVQLKENEAHVLPNSLSPAMEAYMLLSLFYDPYLAESMV